MTITLDSYVNVHSRHGGQKTETFDTRDIVDVKEEQSWWIDDPLLRIVFKTPPSFVFKKEDFVRAITQKSREE